jgi:dTDP-4-dehydrorhamnose reductase
MHPILITGASGFLGCYLCRTSPTKQSTTALFEHHAIPSLPIYSESLDLCDGPRLLNFIKGLKPELIIHAAANSNLDDCEKRPDEARRLNVESTRLLAEFAGREHIRLIFVSSDMVFDGQRGMYREDDTVRPISFYGQTKVEAENMVRDLCPDHVIVRTALIYGRPQYGGTSFSHWLENRLRQGVASPLFYDQFRTPIWVHDLAEAIWHLANSPFVGTIHLAGDNRIDRYQFGLELCRLTGYDSSLLQRVSMNDVASPAPRPVDVSLATDLARTVLHRRLLNTVEGLAKMVSEAIH